MQTLALQLAQMVSTIDPLLGQLLIHGGTTAIGALMGALTPDRRGELLDETLAERRKLTERLARISRGEFTPQEVQQTLSSPALQAIGQSATARGVTGPARQQLVARGQQQLFSGQQQAALQALSPALSAQEQTISQIPQEDLTPFFDDLQGIVTSISLSRQLTKDGSGSDDFPEADEDVQRALQLLANWLGFGG